MSNKKRITLNYQRIFEFLVKYTRKYGYGPSTREIMEATNISSTCVVWYYINRLESEGRITMDHNKRRTIQVVGYTKEDRIKVLQDTIEYQQTVIDELKIKLSKYEENNGNTK